jgi:hypothetical protein
MQLSSSRIVTSGVGLVGMITLAFVLWGHESFSSPARISLPEDWSHHHVVFSNPMTLDQSLRVRQDPRFWHQWFRRNVRRAIPVSEPAFEESQDQNENLPWMDGDWFGWFHRFPRKHHPRPPRNALKRDWAISLGPNATVGAGNYPAKFSFDINTANCGNAAQPDFVVFNTSVATSSQASIVAYDNLYTGCATGTVPSTYWSYNTGGSVVTSVTLSLDGSQVAFVQTPTTVPIANLVLLKWKPTTDNATSTTPDSIPIVTALQYPTCTAPCMTLLPLTGTANDTLSSPFYDFDNDALYVGDDNGSLHKFQPVFTTGTPAEVVTGWPVLLASGLKLSSPVYDSVTGRVFVGSGWNGTTGSKLYAVTASIGAIAATSATSLGKGNGIAAGPIIDSTAGKVYVFLGADNSPSGTCFGGGPCSGVFQFTASSTLATSVEAMVQRGANANTFTLYTGTFDNNYYTSPNSTGNLYVCGNTLGSGTLYQIPVTNGVMSTTSAFGPQLSGLFGSSANAPCSPITEIFNPNIGGVPGIDKVFVSTTGSGSFSCSTGCIYDLPVTSWQPGTSYALGEEITDKFLDIQVVTTAGTSGAFQPSWGGPGSPTPDNTVTWTGKSGLGAGSYGTWQAHTIYSTGSAVLDANGNVETEQFANATSGATQPVWPTTIGGFVSDNGAGWRNVGPPDNFVLTVTGGTSGMVVDNTVTIGTLAGGSQVYFTPLGMGFSTCGAGHGCAVQASQSGLN